MKIVYMSDLHNEFGVMPVEDMGEGDVLILAGDIVTLDSMHRPKVLGKENGQDWFNEVSEKYEHIVYVTGNHEYYNENMRSVDTVLSADLPDSVHFLNNTSCKLNGVWFHGCTLWTAFATPLADMHAEKRMNDFLIIRFDNEEGEEKRFKPWNARQLHETSVYYLENNVKEGDVVVTHHAPSFESVHLTFAGDTLNEAYASDLSELILKTKPSNWIHGHMHHSTQYEIGDTTVRLNPRGYYGHALNPDFDPHAYFEI